MRKHGNLAQRLRHAHLPKWLRAHTVKRILFCLAVLAVLGVAPVYVNNLFGYVPIVTFAALIALCRVYLAVLRHCLAFDELSAFEDCQRGQSVDFIVRLTNKSLLFYPRIDVEFFISDLFGGMETVSSSTITLAPREVRDFILETRFDHIGRFSAGLRSMTLSDPLGLFSTTIPGTRTCYVAVTPKIYNIADLETVAEENSDSVERVLSATENSMDYASVRDYVPGDPLKAIHWKLSARSENYLTRLYESYSNPRLDVVLDFSAPASLSAEEMMDIHDALLETAFSLCYWAESAGMGCQLLYGSKSGETRTINAHLDAWSMLEACSDMPTISADDALGITARELLRSVARSQTSSNIVFVSSRIETGVVREVAEAKHGKKHLVFFALLPHRFEAADLAAYTRPLRSLAGYGIPSYAIAGASELEEGGRL